MQTFTELTSLFGDKFDKRQFPETPSNLYDAAQYILGIGGKHG